MSPDTVSSLFPDRPIRPLPRRRIREKLSPDVAGSIEYPPSAHDTVPLFQYPPYTLKDDGFSIPADSASVSPDARRGASAAGRYAVNEAGVSSGVNDLQQNSSRSVLASPVYPGIHSRPAHNPPRPGAPVQSKPQPPASTTSSVDGYESFENTNNKKKRKIPSAGDSTLGSSHGLATDISSLAISTNSHTQTIDSYSDRSYGASNVYPSSGSFASPSQGMSGSGRGRLGRSVNGRSPLRAIPDGNNTWGGRSPRAALPQWATSDYEGSGIISSAIANAEKLPPQGQENVSLLQQHSNSNKNAPASTQFTFTCDSQVPGTVQWPGHSTKHTMGSQMTADGSGGHGGNAAATVSSSKTTGRSSAKPPRPARRSLDRELDRQARQREQAAVRSWYLNRPKMEDYWICEFCEYERIFGKPPKALIRDYELKDRRQRQEAAERKRTMDKAKAKARKTKKSAKAAAKAGSQSIPGTDHGSSYAPEAQGSPSMQTGEQSTQSEEEHDESPEEPPAAAPADAEHGAPSASRELPPGVRESGTVLSFTEPVDGLQGAIQHLN